MEIEEFEDKKFALGVKIYIWTSMLFLFQEIYGNVAIFISVYEQQF